MQWFYRLLQRFKCYGQQAHVEKKREEQQGAKSSNWKEISEKLKNKKRRKTEKELQYFQQMLISNDKGRKDVSSLAESVESGEIYQILKIIRELWMRINILKHILSKYY